MSLTTQWWRLALIAAALSSARLTQAASDPQSFNFVQFGYSDGATVTGAFTGIDLDNNGILVHFPSDSPPPINVNELTAFSMHFSGNSLAPAFDLTLDDLYGFVFEFDTYGIGDDPAFDPVLDADLLEGIGAIGENHFYTSGLGPTGMIGGYVGGQIELNSIADLVENALDSSELLVLVTRVPEPSTLAMFVAGILVSFASRSRTASS